MPLSEHEQRLLSQMEQQLLADDPRFASAMKGSARRAGAGRRMIIGAVALVVGLLLLVAAVALKNPLVGVAAFVLMLAGAGYAFTAPKKPSGPIGVVGPGGATKPAGRSRGLSRGGLSRGGPSRGSGSFMEKMEHRWHRRRDDRY